MARHIDCPKCGTQNVWKADRTSGRCVNCGEEIIYQSMENPADGYKVYPKKAVEKPPEQPREDIDWKETLRGILLLLYLILFLFSGVEWASGNWLLSIVLSLILGFWLFFMMMYYFEDKIAEVDSNLSEWSDRTMYIIPAKIILMLWRLLVHVGPVVLPFVVMLILCFLLK